MRLEQQATPRIDLRGRQDMGRDEYTVCVGLGSTNLMAHLCS